MYKNTTASTRQNILKFPTSPEKSETVSNSKNPSVFEPLITKQFDYLRWLAIKDGTDGSATKKSRIGPVEFDSSQL